MGNQLVKSQQWSLEKKTFSNSWKTGYRYSSENENISVYQTKCLNGLNSPRFVCF